MPGRLNQIRVAGNNVCLFAGAFTPNGSGVPVAANNVSGYGFGPVSGFTATYSGSTGIYNIDFLEPYPELIVLTPTLVNALTFKVESFTAPGSLRQSNGGRRVQVRVGDAAGAAIDLPAAAGRYIQFVATLRSRVS